MSVRSDLRREMARGREMLVTRPPAPLPDLSDEEAEAWYEADLGPYYAAEEARMRALCPSLFRSGAATPEAAKLDAAPAAPAGPGPDPLEAAICAADTALRRRLATEAPLPSETVREFYRAFIPELHRVAPGECWRHPGAPDEARDAWREAYPEAADRLDELWLHDPHGDRFYATMCEFVAWLKTRPAADHSATASGGDG